MISGLFPFLESTHRMTDFVLKCGNLTEFIWSNLLFDFLTTLFLLNQLRNFIFFPSFPVEGLLSHACSRSWMIVRYQIRTERNNCTGTNWYGGTRFWFDIIWFGPWSEFLVRNSVVRFVFARLVREFRTGTKWFGSYFSKQFIFRTEPITNRVIWSEIGSVRSFGKYI